MQKPHPKKLDLEYQIEKYRYVNFWADFPLHFTKTIQNLIATVVSGPVMKILKILWRSVYRLKIARD